MGTGRRRRSNPAAGASHTRLSHWPPIMSEGTRPQFVSIQPRERTNSLTELITDFQKKGIEVILPFKVVERNDLPFAFMECSTGVETIKAGDRRRGSINRFT